MLDNAQKFVTFHPRCGTSFLFVVMVISMIVYALFPLMDSPRSSPRASCCFR